MKTKLLLLLLFAAQAAVAVAQVPVKQVCDKAEYRIRMRDGVALHTTVYTPKGATDAPMLVQRTPYGCAPYGEEQFPRSLEKGYLRSYIDAGYIVVLQDVRGRYMSEGDYENVRPAATSDAGTDERTDAYDTVEWLVGNVAHTNGRVGFFGSSYPGFYAMQGALCGHRAVVAASPQAPVTDWFMGDDAHHNGVLMLCDAFTFLPGMSHTDHKPAPKMPAKRSFDMAPDIYDFFLRAGTLDSLRRMVAPASFWNDMAAHPDYDAWWQERDVRRLCHDIRPALLIVGGTFDAEDCFGAWELYKAVRRQSPRTDCRLVVGPWAHGAWRKGGQRLGSHNFGVQAGWRYYVEHFERPFFDHFLRGAEADIPRVSVFVSGSNRWEHRDEWAEGDSSPVRLYFGAGGRLSFDKPKRGGVAHYTSDPAHPVPYMEHCTKRREKEYMIADQRFASARRDVLTYATEPLAEPLTLAGEVRVHLRVALSTTDADFVVKLIDAYPDGAEQHAGEQMLVRGDIMRGRYRRSFSAPEPFVPHRADDVEFRMADIAHTFAAGHRIMVQVQSSWFPVAERSPQQFIDLWHCTAADFVKCRVKVYGGESFIEVGSE